MKRRVLRAVLVSLLAGVLVMGTESMSVLAEEEGSAAESDESGKSLVGQIIFAQCDDYVNIYSAASTDSEVTGRIYNNDCAKIVSEEADGWIGIKSGNAAGYVKAEYFVAGKKARAVAKEVAYTVAIVQADDLSIRSEPSEDGVVLDCAQTGDELEVVEKDGEWLKVARGNDLYGYINASYVKCKTYYPVAKTLEELGEEEEGEAAAEEPEETADEVTEAAAEETAEETAAAGEESAAESAPGNEEEPAAEAVEEASQETEELFARETSYEEAADEEFYEESSYEGETSAAEVCTETDETEAYVETEAYAETEPPADETEAYAETETPADVTEAYAETETPADVTEAYAETEAPADETEAYAEAYSYTETEAPATEAAAEAAAETSSDDTDPSSEIGVIYDSTYNGDEDYYYNADEDAYYYGTALLSFTDSEEDEEEAAEESAVEETAAEEITAEETVTEESVYEETDEEAVGSETADESASADSSVSGQDIADYATQFVGNDYVYGGTSLTDGADCSGFVQSVYADSGISVARVAADQAEGGTTVEEDDLQAGDLLFYSSDGEDIDHVAIYIGDDTIVHAANSDRGIVTDYAYYDDPVTAVRYY